MQEQKEETGKAPAAALRAEGLTSTLTEPWRHQNNLGSNSYSDCSLDPKPDLLGAFTYPNPGARLTFGFFPYQLQYSANYISPNRGKHFTRHTYVYSLYFLGLPRDDPWILPGNLKLGSRGKVLPEHLLFASMCTLWP